MSPVFTRDEVREILRRQNVADAAIERAIAKEFGLAESGTAVPQAADYLRVVGPLLAYPIRLTLPWSALCSDNEREAASIFMVKGTPRPRKVMTARYKAARATIVKLARAAMTVAGQSAPPLDLPLWLVADVYAPTQRRVDVANFAKGVHDAMSKIVYTDDRWLQDARWRLVGMDMDRPRAEISVGPR